MTHLEIVGGVTNSSIPVLITTVRSLHTLEVFKLTNEYTVRPHKNLRAIRGYPAKRQALYWDDFLIPTNTDLSELVEAAASNNQIQEVGLPQYAYRYLPQHIQTRHQQLLKCNEDIDPYTEYLQGKNNRAAHSCCIL